MYDEAPHADTQILKIVRVAFRFELIMANSVPLS